MSETWFKPNLNYKFNGYKVVRQDRLDGTTGDGILIKNNIRFQEVTLNNIPDSIQACAVNISIKHRSLTLLSVYCPPSIRTSSQIFLNIFNNCTCPTIIGGDFSGHHNLWSSYKINSPGSQIVNALNQSYLVLLNDGSATKISRSGQNSAVDLSFATPDVANRI
nr:unnamed protein product [Callosobruchus analis]